MEDPRGPAGREPGAEAGERRVPPPDRDSGRRSHPRPALILLGLGSAFPRYPPSCGDGCGALGEDEEAAAAAVQAGAPGREGCWAEGRAEGRAGSARPAAAALQGTPPRPRHASARESSPRAPRPRAPPRHRCSPAPDRRASPPLRPGPITARRRRSLCLGRGLGPMALRGHAGGARLDQ